MNMKNFKFDPAWLWAVPSALVVTFVLNYQNCSRYEFSKNRGGNGGLTAGGVDNGNGNGNGNGGGTNNTSPTGVSLNYAPANPIVGDNVIFTITDVKNPPNTTYNWFFIPPNSSTIPVLIHSGTDKVFTIPQIQAGTHNGTYWVEGGGIKSNEVVVTATSGVNAPAQDYIDELVEQITHSLEVASVIKDMISDDANLAFQCLQRNTNCSQMQNPDRRVLHVYKIDGRLLVSDGLSATSGLDYDSARCNTFSANPADNDCPFHVELAWDVKCPNGMSVCDNTDIVHNIVIKIDYKVPENMTASPVVVTVPVNSNLFRFDSCDTNLNGTGVRLFTLQTDLITRSYYCLFRECKTGYILSADKKICSNSPPPPPTCLARQHLETGVCVGNTRVTPIPNGTKYEIWSPPSGTYVFNHVTCNSGYHPSGQQCVADCVNATWSAAKAEAPSTCTTRCQRRTFKTCVAGNACGAKTCIGANHVISCKRTIKFATLEFCAEPVMGTVYTPGQNEYVGTARCSYGQGECAQKTSCSGSVNEGHATDGKSQGFGWSLATCQARCGALMSGAGHWHNGTTGCVCGSQHAHISTKGDCDGCRGFSCH